MKAHVRAGWRGGVLGVGGRQHARVIQQRQAPVNCRSSTINDSTFSGSTRPSFSQACREPWSCRSSPTSGFFRDSGHGRVLGSRFGGTLRCRHRRVPGPMPGQRLAAATSKAATARRLAKAIADQHASGAMWRLPQQTAPEAIPGGSSPGAVPERHRELVPHAGPTGSVRSATDAQAVHAGPAAARWQAPGGEAGLAYKQWPVRERVGEELERRLRRAGVIRSPERVRELGMDHCSSLWGRAGIGGQATGRGRAARGGGCRVRITSGRCRARARGWREGRALARREGVDDDAATRMRRVLYVPPVAGAIVTRSRLQGLRSCDFGGSMPPRAAS